MYSMHSVAKNTMGMFLPTARFSPLANIFSNDSRLENGQDQSCTEIGSEQLTGENCCQVPCAAHGGDAIHITPDQQAHAGMRASLIPQAERNISQNTAEHMLKLSRGTAYSVRRS